MCRCFGKKLRFDFKQNISTVEKNESIEDIVSKLEYAIEQHSSFQKVIPAETVKEMEELNKKREY